MGTVNVESLIPSMLLEKLNQKEILSLDEYTSKNLYWFMIVDAVPKLTKNKKPYFILNAMGATGEKYKIFCWGVPNGSTLAPYSFCVGEVDKNDFGMSTSWYKIKLFDI